jgi:prepilin-type N-terminal cleavage/methylation domain-containing protein
MNKTNYAKWLRMATITKNNKAIRGFTLVEMIGVLAIIAILAGMLIPKIFEAIRNSRINATLEAYNTLKAAVLENYAKWGKFANADGSQYTDTSSPFDRILLQEGRIEDLAHNKIQLWTGTYTTDTPGAYVQVVTGAGGPTSNGYNLDGDTSTPPTIENANAAYTVQLVIKDVAVRDAQELSMRLDGPNLSETNPGNNDYKGRVEYTAPGNNNNNKTDVYVYITHQ